MAFSPLETSEVISGTIIQAVDEGGTMINVTPSLIVPRLSHRDYCCTTTEAHNRLYGQANYCTAVYSEPSLRFLRTSFFLLYLFTIVNKCV